MRKVVPFTTAFVWLLLIAPSALALDSSQPPGDNFDLSHWYLQLPTHDGELTGTSGTVDSASTSELVGGFTNDYFYTGPDGAMTFWAPDNGARTGGSSHPRSELREELVPGNTAVNWMPYGTHILTATCVVSNVPSDANKVCIAQIHQFAGANIPMTMILFYNGTIYANYWSDGSDNNSVAQWHYGAFDLGSIINYRIEVENGLLSVAVNGVTNSFDLFNQGTNWEASSNAVCFKAGAYSQTANTCDCSTDGACVAFYSLTRYHAPNITNQPVSFTTNEGANASFNVGTSGNGALSYQWWFNATNLLAGATNAVLTLTNVSPANAGSYRVVVSDSTSSFMSITSAAAGLTVILSGTNMLFSTPGTTTWICPPDVNSIRVECWGGGGAGGSALRTPDTSNVEYGGGGAGGAYARVNNYPVTPGQTYYVMVGAGGLAATGTLTNDTRVPGSDSWFNSANEDPIGTNGCLARGGDGGECAVGNTAASRYGLGGVGSTYGCIGDVSFAGGNGGQLTASTGYGGSGGGSGGTESNGNPGGTNGVATPAVIGGGPGGAPNPTGGSSGPGQAPVTGPGGGGGGARATTQRTGGNGADGQVLLTYMITTNEVVEPAKVIIHAVLASPQKFQLNCTGTPLATYLVEAKNNLMDLAWLPIATNVANSNGVCTFTDPDFTNFPQRFYRLAAP